MGNGDPNQMKISPVGQEEELSLAGVWHYKIGADLKKLPSIPKPPEGLNSNTPTALYNGMIAPVIPFTIKGVIWYQGESNHLRAYQYRKLFPTLIANWRDDWGEGAFPFYYVQIAPFQYEDDKSQELREAQLLALSVPNTGMVVTTDIGNVRNIHPSNKQELGRRLALWALAKNYGKKGLVYSGPIYRNMQIEGNKIRLFFDLADNGLVGKGGPLTHFTIASEDKKFLPAISLIEDNTILLSCDSIKNPIAVRFAWSDTAEPNLFNKADLPASPFRTDNWEE
ncbi:MAG: sialate O-acetylesterase [candidate division WOR-3 bacterium]|nr:sialate O-acetylesterase [candidate division WOR-3 bacterium]